MLQLGSGVPSASALFPLTKTFYHLYFYYLIVEIESYFFQFSISAIESYCIICNALDIVHKFENNKNLEMHF